LGGWAFDIGLAPLRDNHFNRGKSNLRWLEYSALKIPTIASDVEPFKEMQFIFKATSENDWRENMRSLFILDKWREGAGQESYVEAKRKYNLKKVAKEFLNIIKGVYDGTQVA